MSFFAKDCRRLFFLPLKYSQEDAVHWPDAECGSPDTAILRRSNRCNPREIPTAYDSIFHRAMYDILLSASYPCLCIPELSVQNDFPVFSSVWHKIGSAPHTNSFLKYLPKPWPDNKSTRKNSLQADHRQAFRGVPSQFFPRGRYARSFSPPHYNEPHDTYRL